MNGIFWEIYDDKVKAIVEVTEHYRCVTVVISLNDIEKSHKVFNDVVKTILTLKSQMHSFKCEEYLIAPSDVGKSLLMNKRILYNIKMLLDQCVQKVMLWLTKTQTAWALKRRCDIKKPKSHRLKGCSCHNICIHYINNTLVYI